MDFVVGVDEGVGADAGEEAVVGLKIGLVGVKCYGLSFLIEGKLFRSDILLFLFFFW